MSRRRRGKTLPLNHIPTAYSTYLRPFYRFFPNPASRKPLYTTQHDSSHSTRLTTLSASFLRRKCEPDRMASPRRLFVLMTPNDRSDYDYTSIVRSTTGKPNGFRRAEQAMHYCRTHAFGWIQTIFSVLRGQTQRMSMRYLHLPATFMAKADAGVLLKPPPEFGQRASSIGGGWSASKSGGTGSGSGSVTTMQGPKLIRIRVGGSDRRDIPSS